VSVLQAPVKLVLDELVLPDAATLANLCWVPFFVRLGFGLCIQVLYSSISEFNFLSLSCRSPSRLSSTSWCFPTLRRLRICVGFVFFLSLSFKFYIFESLFSEFEFQVCFFHRHPSNLSSTSWCFLTLRRLRRWNNARGALKKTLQ